MDLYYNRFMNNSALHDDMMMDLLTLSENMLVLDRLNSYYCVMDTLKKLRNKNKMKKLTIQEVRTESSQAYFSTTRVTAEYTLKIWIECVDFEFCALYELNGATYMSEYGTINYAIFYINRKIDELNNGVSEQK